MAKKKTVKKIKSVSFLGTKMPLNETLETKVSMAKKTEPVEVVVRQATTDESIVMLFQEIDIINKRIDAIVAAHDKCKSLKGL